MSKLYILLYHGVISESLKLGGRNSSGKHIRVSEFAKQMDYISKNFNLVSMNDIENHVSKKKLITKDSVAVTFDDGFLNNYTIAWEILEYYRVPATFYLSTGFISSKKKIWTDILEIIFFNRDSDYIKVEDEIIELKTINARITEFVKLKNKLKKFKNNHLKKFMQKISNLNNTSFDITPELYDFMTWDYIKEMDQSDLITFGAHTVDHVSLTKVSKKQAQNQIKNSLFELSEKLKRKIKFFSYPEGQQDDYDNEIINFLKSMKINHCPSAINGSNSLSNMDPFNLKRIMVGFEGRKFNLIT